MRIDAPAKLNVGLRIVGRRSDGYHLLETLMVPLELADEIDIKRVHGGAISLSLDGDCSGLETGPDNLIWKAVKAFRVRTATEMGLEIRLTKRIPVAAGLGGGSSNAAAVLRVLDYLNQSKLTSETLLDIAVEVGADVPFFLDPRPARVTGIGEVVRPEPNVPAVPVVLLVPDESLSTKMVYQRFNASNPSLTPQKSPSTLSLRVALSRVRDGEEPGKLSGLLANDLEATATELCPGIADMRLALVNAGALAVGLSGSGPAVYGIFESQEAARGAFQGLRTNLARSVHSWLSVTRASA